MIESSSASILNRCLQFPSHKYNNSLILSLEQRQNSAGYLSGEFLYYVNGRKSDVISIGLGTIQCRIAEDFIRSSKETAADCVSVTTVTFATAIVFYHMELLLKVQRVIKNDDLVNWQQNKKQRFQNA